MSREYTSSTLFLLTNLLRYYQLIRLGKKGYTSIMRNLTLTADYLSDSLEALGFIIMSQKNGDGVSSFWIRFNPLKSNYFLSVAYISKGSIRLQVLRQVMAILWPVPPYICIELLPWYLHS